VIKFRADASYHKTEAEFGRRLTDRGAVACYTLLADVFLFFCFLIRKLVLKIFKFLFPFEGEGRGELKG